jgi:positive regulator of sigma E activity
MVYDPVLQMMVDPDTRQPVYSNSNGGKFRIATAVVTSGCGNCPKNDGCKDNYGC